MYIPILVACLMATPQPATPQAATPQPEAPPSTPSERLVQALEPAALREIVLEALERNPDIARARHQAAALAARAPQVRTLPDPTASLTLFVLPPETRVGPQRLQAMAAQKLPWFGKLKRREQAALLAAAAAETRVEAIRLDVLTEVRRLAYEHAFLGLQEDILAGERSTLARYEEAARARYASGSGLQQETLRIQAQITRVDTRLLKIRERSAELLAAINALRDRPADLPAACFGMQMPDPVPLELELEALRGRAGEARPEIVAADTEIARLETLVELAELGRRPDVTVGLGYTVVESREDRAGRLNPPSGNGNDILALTGSINLPRKPRVAAAVEEAQALRRAAEEDKRRLLAEIERHVGDLATRLPMLLDHWKLLDGVLQIQARESLRSAEAAYTTGKLNAVDLLDSEVVLFEVRTAAARTRTDLAVARAQLERAVASPLIEIPSPESSHHDH